MAGASACASPGASKSNRSDRRGIKPSLARLSADEIADGGTDRRTGRGGTADDPVVVAALDLQRLRGRALVLERLAEQLRRRLVAPGHVLVGVQDQERRQPLPGVRDGRR